LRDALEEFQGGIGKSARLRQDPRHRVLRGQTPLGLSDVRELLSQHGIDFQQLGSPFRDLPSLFLVGLPQCLEGGWHPLDEKPQGCFPVRGTFWLLPHVFLDFS
jgi:hypothetical protein